MPDIAGNDEVGVLKGQDLEEVVDDLDPRLTVGELVYAQISGFIDSGYNGGAEGHITGYWLTSLDEPPGPKGNDANPQTETATFKELDGSNTSTTDYNPRFTETDQVYYVAAPHQVGGDLAAGSGATMHMFHEHLNFREMGHGEGPILDPSDSINSIIRIAESNSGTWYENIQVGIDVRDFNPRR